MKIAALYGERVRGSAQRPCSRSLRRPEMGCGSGMTCWRRLRDWQAAGRWEGLHAVLLSRLAGADPIELKAGRLSC
jgi:transposase